MERIDDAIQLSVDWIIQEQDPRTGGWSDRVGHPPNSLNTAEALIALSISGEPLEKVGPAVNRGVAFLIDQQEREGAECGCWCRSAGRGESPKVPDIVRTSIAIEALFKTGHGEEQAAADAVEWLRAQRNSEAGWPFRSGLDSELAPTCFALLALIDAYELAGSEELKVEIDSALSYLDSTYRNPDDGSYGRHPPLVAAHTILVTTALQSAAAGGLIQDRSKERRALHWLLKHPNDARRVVEEDFLIDPSDSGDASYSFVYTTDSLLLRVLFAAEDPDVSRSTLARDALMSLSDKLNPDGGAFGYRKTPWATARAVTALVSASSGYSTFPTREPEYVDSKKTGPYLFVLMVLVMATLVTLALIEQLNLWSGVLLALLVLAILVAYGKIGEKTFAEAFGQLVGTWSKKEGK